MRKSYVGQGLGKGAANFLVLSRHQSLASDDPFSLQPLSLPQRSGVGLKVSTF